MSIKGQIDDYNESSKLFLAFRLELENILNSINSYEKITSYESKKVGIYRYLKKLIPCFDALRMVSKLNSAQPLITLQRMIVDNYAVLYLLTNHSNKEVQLLRYYLFILDATKSRPDILNNFSSKITLDIPNDAFESAKDAIANDNQSSIELHKLIKEKQLDKLVNNTIIETANWKFKDSKETNQYKNKYNWVDLYKIARIPEHHAEMYQNYHSTYVHGLGMTLMTDKSEAAFPFTVLGFYSCSIIISLIIKIITLEYVDEIKEIKLNPKTIEFMNTSWTKWN